ncbi:MAG: Flp pilus assembly complex ATPase component TadA [Rhodothermales bacterium]|nr:Flp pilus assembly complex ATPase component TadA [Rhodothermales bacterium]
MSIAEVENTSLGSSRSGRFASVPPLPADVDQIIAKLPPNLDGIAKMEWYAERVNALPSSVRDAMRAVVDAFVARMPEYDASDLDFGADACNGLIWYRLDGLKVPKPDLGEYSPEQTNVLLLNLMFPRQQQRLFDKYAIDYGSSLDMGPDEPPRRFRTTVFFDNRELALSQRMLAWKPRPLRSLGFHPLVERGLMFRYLRDGLTLITGVTGSGKSTTLDSIVNANNNDIEAQIIIVAQPLEYIHKSAKCVVRHREVGTDGSRTSTEWFRHSGRTRISLLLVKCGMLTRFLPQWKWQIPDIRFFLRCILVVPLKQSIVSWQSTRPRNRIVFGFGLPMYCVASYLRSCCRRSVEVESLPKR